jgi:hypothetical protein
LVSGQTGIKNSGYSCLQAKPKYKSHGIPVYRPNQNKHLRVFLFTGQTKINISGYSCLQAKPKKNLRVLLVYRPNKNKKLRVFSFTSKTKLKITWYSCLQAKQEHTLTFDLQPGLQGVPKTGKSFWREGEREREREVLVRCLQPAEGCLLKVGSLDFSLAGWLAILAFHPPSNASMQSTVPFGVTTAILAS